MKHLPDGWIVQVEESGGKVLFNSLSSRLLWAGRIVLSARTVASVLPRLVIYFQEDGKRTFRLEWKD
jgi:hypothetical protein